MGSVIRKIKNVSDCQIPVQVDPFTTVFLPKNGMLENKTVYNLASIRKFCEIEEDLGEISPVREGKQQLYD